MATTLNLSLELDPVFLRGLGYLHSKTKDSADKLKALLDESMSRGGEPSYRSSLKDMEISKGSVSKLSLSKQDSKSSSSSSSPSSSSSSSGSSNKSLHSEKSKKEAEKRPVEKVRVDPGEAEPPKKQQRLEKQQQQQQQQQENRSSSPVTVQTSRDLGPPSVHDYDETNADDFAMEMGLACVMCRQMTVTMGNQLVECQECHNLYHQDCHKPQVTDKEANDPRLIWYCARCTRQMKRMAQKAQKPPQKSSPVAASVAPVVKDPLVKKVEAKARPETPSSFQAFKRTELKTSAPAVNPGTGVSSSTGGGLSGWAAFGAKTTPSSAMSSTKAASSGSSGNNANTTNNNSSNTTGSGQKPAGLSGLAGAKAGPGATKAPGGNGSVSSGAAPSKQPPPLTLGGKQTLGRSSSGEGQGKAPSGGGGSPGSSQHGSGGSGNGGGSNGNGGNGNNSGNGSKQAAAPGDKAPTSQESQLNAMKRLQMVKKKAAQKKLKK